MIDPIANRTPLVPPGSGRMSSTLEITVSWKISPVESLTETMCSWFGTKPVIEQLNVVSVEYEERHPVYESTIVSPSDRVE